MLNFEFLPTVHEKDVEVGRDFKLHTQQSSCQKAALGTNESEIGGTNQVHTLQWSPEGAAVPENESEDVIMTDRAPIESQDRGQPSDNTQEVQIIPSSRLTRAASKRQEKAVETWKQARADSVEENPMNAQVCLQICQSELKDTKDKLAASIKALKETKDQLIRNKKILATCRRGLRESKGVSYQLKKANSDLQKALKADREELSKCRDDLFSLQEVAQVPDSIILKRFELVSQQIVHWIDTEVATFEKAHPKVEPDYIFSAGKQAFTAEFLRLHPGAGEHLARYMIHYFLQDHVFGKKVYFFGMPEETAQLLQEAELKLTELDPPRDSVAIASWRSETLKALVKTTKCVNHFHQQSQCLNNDLFKRLSVALPGLFSGRQAHATFYDQVLLPAVKLANTMRMSTSEYVVSIQDSLLTKFKPVTIDTLRMRKMVDSKSEKHLKPDSPIVADNDGVIGKVIICLEPGLYRVTKGKETTLQQETILVELYHPLAKRVKTSA